MKTEESSVDLKRILERFIRAGVQHTFKIKDEDTYQGLANRIENGMLLMWDSGPLGANIELRIPIADIDLTTLAYWDKEQDQWVDFEAA